MIEILEHYWRALLWFDGRAYSGLAVTLWLLVISIGIGFITFVVMFILYVLAISISMSISASFWKQLKDNVE